ncbi:MAG: hypothetical protein AW08_01871 [Candidatus Accumulibacter adjunctus]|uniref:Uncharacterized protein n=1 Tax=Candidatus Accumulibacter adjunctus TaxID=1454001 RepID=A0A011PMQ6_9PROT|nr:MAG: hypothetical protein AW08_01871 [Candidatus Accumulibacter adjunctus]
MQRRILGRDRLVAAFLAGCVLFNYPLLAVFDRPSEVFDIPLIFAYIFLAWVLVIALMAWAIEARSG